MLTCMATLQVRPRKLSVEQFVERYDGMRGRYELYDGDVYAMAGGTVMHADVALNILIAMAAQFRGGPCRGRGSDSGLWIDDETLFYPDVAAYCDLRDADETRAVRRWNMYPSIVVDVLSPSTVDDDTGYKLRRYRELSTLGAIVFVDTAARTVQVHRRDGAEWRFRSYAGTFELVIDAPRLVLPSDVIFA